MADISFHCQNCGGSLVVDISAAGQNVTCPECGKATQIPSPQSATPRPPVAFRTIRSETSGAGCALQAIGLLLFFAPFFIGIVAGLFGVLIGIILLSAGSRLAKKLICSNCGNRVEKTSTVCPTCQAELRSKSQLLGFVVLLLIIAAIVAAVYFAVRQ